MIGRRRIVRAPYAEHDRYIPRDTLTTIKQTDTMSIVEMRVPTVGESINEVTLSRWLKEDGAIVRLDEPICEFESDKATLEFPA